MKVLNSRYDVIWKVVTFLSLFVINVLMLVYYKASLQADERPYVSDEKVKTT